MTNRAQEMNSVGTTAVARGEIKGVTIDGIDFWIGQKWVENDKRTRRVVTVIGWDILMRRIQVQFLRRTWVMARRFDGTGYTLASLSVPHAPDAR